MTKPESQFYNPDAFVYAPKGTRKPFRLFGVTFRSPMVTYCSHCQHQRFKGREDKSGKDISFNWCDWEGARDAKSGRFLACRTVNREGQCGGFRAHPSMSITYVSKSLQDYIRYLNTRYPRPPTDYGWVPMCGVG